jgi:hypothetical protein
MKILSLITLGNGVKMTFEVKRTDDSANVMSSVRKYTTTSPIFIPEPHKENRLWFEMDEPADKEMMVTVYEVPKDAPIFIDTGKGAFTPPTTNSVGDLRSPVGTEGSNLEHLRCSEEEFGNGKEYTFHQSGLRYPHMLLHGTYIFTFSNDQYTQLSVVFENNNLSLGEY